MHTNIKLTRDEKPIRFLFENSLFLIGGTLLALIWANSNPETHDYFFNKFELKWMFIGVPEHADDHATSAGEDDGHTESGTAENGHADDSQTHGDQAHGDEEHSGHHGITWHFIINDVLMALFFAIAAKEVWEALLPGGPLSSPKRAAMPLLATLGGIVGPALFFVVGVFAFSDWSTLGRGWAIPTATDIAFSYLVARLIFGNGHPAIAFLLLLAIADDAAGLVIIAVFYPQGDLALEWLLLCLGGMFLAFLMAKRRIYSFWWYLLIPGVMCWFSFYKTGIHAALGLVPIIPFMPHAQTDLGIFAVREMQRSDTLNSFEHFWKNPVEVILGLFGLCNAGVAFTSVGTGTWLILVALVVGKPIGITFCTWIGDKFFKLEVPEGMGYKHIVTLGCIAGIGFTVALFVSTAAFNPNDMSIRDTLNAVKMGALLSFGAAIVSFIVAKVLGVKPDKPDGKSSADESLRDAYGKE